MMTTTIVVVVVAVAVGIDSLLDALFVVLIFGSPSLTKEKLDRVRQDEGTKNVDRDAPHKLHENGQIKTQTRK